MSECVERSSKWAGPSGLVFSMQSPKRRGCLEECCHQRRFCAVFCSWRSWGWQFWDPAPCFVENQPTAAGRQGDSGTTVRPFLAAISLESLWAQTSFSQLKSFRVRQLTFLSYPKFVHRRTLRLFDCERVGRDIALAISRDWLNVAIEGGWTHDPLPLSCW